MLASMTGFGRFETNDKDWTHVWEIRSVNGRFLDVKWRMPSFLRCMETEWEKTVRRYGARGRVDISLNLDIRDAALLGVTFNKAQAQGMVDQLREYAGQCGAEFTPDLNRMLTISTLWREGGGEPDPNLARSLTSGLESALADWRESKLGEGKVMVDDLMERTGRMTGFAAEIRERIPQVLEEKKTSLLQRVQEMLETAGAEFSEERLLQEVAILTDKLDVSEELTRLDAHLDRLREVLGEEGEQGKRLDFIVQETFREINTCGNKAQDIAVSRLVVDFKAELEKCREQVQNME